MAAALVDAGARCAAAVGSQALGTWLGCSHSAACDCSCHFDASPDEALIALLKGQLDRCGPEHLHGHPTVVASCPPVGHARLEVVLALALGLCARDAVCFCLRRTALTRVEREDNYWHERVSLGRITSSRWVVVTPHFDIYEKDLSDALQLCLVGPTGGLPTKLPGHLLRMDMDRFGRNEKQLLEEGQLLAAEVRREEGLADEEAGLPALPAPSDDAPAAKALTDRASAGDAVRWVVQEARAGYHHGDELLAGTVPSRIAGDRGIVELADGTMLAVAKAETHGGTATPRDGDRAGEQELRTLPVRYNQGGSRVRDFAEAVDIMSTSTMG
ncbi:unnamed protein product, partial [Prorocentrum cordatum]